MEDLKIIDDDVKYIFKEFQKHDWPSKYRSVNPMHVGLRADGWGNIEDGRGSTVTGRADENLYF